MDPDREARIDELSGAVEEQLRTLKDRFQLVVVADSLGISDRDLQLVANRVFANALVRVWKDRRITSRERAGLDLIADKLQISETLRHELEHDAGLSVFEQTLASAVSDGKIDPKERDCLDEIAQELGLTVRALMTQYFVKEGEGFLRGLFASMVYDNNLSREQLACLKSATHSLGFNEGELLKVIRPQAERFVEHVLADAKADSYLKPEERTTLDWLIANLGLSSEFKSYVEAEINSLQLYSDIQDGRLPSLSVNDPSLRAGEIVHTRCSVRYTNVRQLKSGPRIDQYNGTLLITDLRLMFTSTGKSFDVRHKRVLQVVPVDHGFELRTGGKGTGKFEFGGRAWLATAIYMTAIGRANQTIVARPEGDRPSRHIPRDVRQRVWQKYGGICAACSANYYLEFDHIIPVAKGGSNAENNIQILCRGCNLKKSDRI